MVQIVINNQPIQLLETIPKEIYSLTIDYAGFMPIDLHTASLVRAWCRELKQSITCEWIQVNGVLVQTSEI